MDESDVVKQWKEEPETVPGTYTEEELEKYERGAGCKCFATHSGECGCKNVDWRSVREVHLEAGVVKWTARALRAEDINRKLAAELRELRDGPKVPVSACCGIEMPDFDECDRCPKCKDHTSEEESDE